MNIKQQPSFIAWRFYLVLFFIVLAAVGLAIRVIDLTILDQPFLRHQGDERVLRMVSTPGFRGMVVDRNGAPLAVSTSVYSIWINPQEFEPSEKELSQIARLLGVKANKISGIMNLGKSKKREFSYLKRGDSPLVAKQIKSLDVPGLYAQEEYRRYYPEGEVMAHVLGFTNIDDVGQEGVELAYNDWLKGVEGKKWVVKDRTGRVISNVQMIQEQKPGHDLMLSIDRRIQYLAYRELLKGIGKFQAGSGSVVVLDVKTGEVLAMVNYPSFNPNNRDKSKKSSYRNRAVTDTFEPGSTVKAFSIAGALESKKVTPNTLIKTYPGWIRVDRHLISDVHYYGDLTVQQILQKSSNVGISKIMWELPPDKVWDIYRRVGFGESTGIGFPGEQSGVLVKHHPWPKSTVAALGYGYGLSVTTVQLARAYAVLANEGVKMPVSLLRPNEPLKGEKVMDKKLANKMMSLLESVLQKGGTGKQAVIPGYRVAGKTGTARVASGGSYNKSYISSFVGIAPVSDPRFVVAVIIHEPQGKNYYGGVVSAPIFEKVMEGTLRIFDVSPDGE